MENYLENVRIEDLDKSKTYLITVEGDMEAFYDKALKISELFKSLDIKSIIAPQNVKVEEIEEFLKKNNIKIDNK